MATAASPTSATCKSAASPRSRAAATSLTASASRCRLALVCEAANRRDVKFHVGVKDRRPLNPALPLTPGHQAGAGDGIQESAKVIRTDFALSPHPRRSARRATPARCAGHGRDRSGPVWEAPRRTRSSVGSRRLFRRMSARPGTCRSFAAPPWPKDGRGSMNTRVREVPFFLLARRAYRRRQRHASPPNSST